MNYVLDAILVSFYFPRSLISRSINYKQKFNIARVPPLLNKWLIGRGVGMTPLAFL